MLEFSKMASMNMKRYKYRRQDLNKKKSLKDVWRKPKGLHSKQRLSERTRTKLVKVGAKKAPSLRFLHPSGFFPKVLRNIREVMEAISKKNLVKEGYYLSRTLGKKKKKLFFDLLSKEGLKIFNPPKNEKL